MVAIDLCGGEEPHFPGKYVEVLKLAKEYGYRITIHAGEAGVGENVLEAINLLNAERIGHGIYIKNCAEAYKLVKEKIFHWRCVQQVICILKLSKAMKPILLWIF